MSVHSKNTKRVLALVLVFALVLPLLGITGTAAEENTAVAVGDVFAPDMSAWGTQNNNGWYYMYRDVSGVYHEMPWYDSSASVDWQRNRFASDPFGMGEMFFIDKDIFFVGENGTKPVFAFKAPASGQIKLTLLTHSTSVIHMSVLKGTELLKDVVFSTTGSIQPGGMTESTVTVDVLKDEWLYLVCSSDDLGTQRQGWINEYSVEYLSVGEPVKAGDVFAPDMNAWGTQNNNGWYYLYKNTDGSYKEMTFFDGAAEISWQQNAYSAPMAEVAEMFFINKDVFFVGENGRKPVYAFQAPSGGKVKLYVEIHGLDVTHLDVFKNTELAKTIDFVTTGTLEGGFTAHEIELEVKKGDWIYMDGYSTDHNTIRQGWVRNYKVTYTSVGSGVVAGDKFAPDMNAWGTQNNNGWYYLFQNTDRSFQEMTYFDGTAEIGWQQNAYSAPMNEVWEMFFINRNTFFVGENGRKPVYAFQAPATGTVDLYFENHGVEVMNLTVTKNTETLQNISFNTTGTLEGGFTGHSLTLDVVKGDWIYLICASNDMNVTREGWVRNYSVAYKTVDQDVAAGDQFVLDLNAWGQQNINNWYYLYKNTDGSYKEMTFFDGTAAIDWQKNAYSAPMEEVWEMFFINKDIFFVGENGRKPVYAFKAPAAGNIDINVEIHGLTDVHIGVYKNADLLNTIDFVTTGTLPGGFTAHTVNADVAKGDWIYLVGYVDDPNANRQGWIRNHSIKYNTVGTGGNTPDEPVETPKVEESALDWNMKQEYYTLLNQKLADKSTPMTWLFVGDSITANDGDVSKGYRNYSEIFEGYLTNQLDRPNDRVVNTAVSGWKAGNINYGRDIAAYSPDVVYIKVGTNDAFGTDLAALNFKATLKELYEKIIASGAIPVIAIANGFSSAWGNTQQTADFALRYPTVQRELAYELNLLMVDYFTVYAQDQNRADNNWFCPDTIHPNRQGFLVHAQTLINDLGLKQGELGIVTQNPDTVIKQEVLSSMVLDPAVFGYASHIADGAAVKLAQLKELLANGFVLLGGDNAVGKSASFITRRSIAQLLDNNNQKGRQETFWGTVEEISAKLGTLSGDKAILLMPELINGQGSTDALAAAIDAALAAGKKIALITTPVSAGDAQKAAKDAFAAELKALAASKGIPCIDIHGYFAAIAAKVSRINTEWYDAAGVLNYAGAIEAATLIGNALEKDTVSFSSKSYWEDFSAENWGHQGVNNWYYMYQDKQTGTYAELPYISAADAAQSWIADRFANPDPFQFLFVGKEVHHVSATMNAVKAFKAPASGCVVIKVGVKRHDTDVSEGGTKGSMYLTINKNANALPISGDNTKITVLAGGGAYQYYTLEVNVKAGDMLYFVISADEACQGYMTQSVTYIDAAVEVNPDTGSRTLGLWLALMAACVLGTAGVVSLGKKTGSC